MRQYTYMEEFESEVDDVVHSMWTDLMDADGIMGDRPYGDITGDRWQQAEQYLTLRDDTPAWNAKISEWAASKGRKAAEFIAISEQTRLEKLIADMGGYEAVRLGLLARRMRRVEPGMQGMRRLNEHTKAQVLPPLAPMNEIDMLARFTSEPEAIEGELA